MEDYQLLASRALQHYDLDVRNVVFIQHNAGIVYRVETPDQQYILKLYKRVGEGDDSEASELEVGMHWLAEMAQATGIVVQMPIATKAGAFVDQIASDSSKPINCTLQRWLNGRLINGDFSPEQVYRIGVLLARLHQHSQHHPVSNLLHTTQHDAEALRVRVATLRTVLDESLYSQADHARVVAASKRIAAMIAALGNEPVVWGAVHGDIHHANLLIDGDQIYPIDFTGLRVAHYLYDIGITLYHILYQGPAICRELLRGYQSIRALSEAQIISIEEFITYAALDNIAWNSTIPAQVGSPLFQRNLRQLIDQFCGNVARGRSFLQEHM